MTDIRTVDHPNKVLSRAREFRSNSSFCDLVLVVDGQDFPVHKVIVAAASEYFRSLIQYDASPSSLAHISCATQQHGSSSTPNITAVDSPSISGTHDDEQGEGSKLASTSSTTESPSTSDTHGDNYQGEGTKTASISNTTAINSPATSDTCEHDQGEGTRPACTSNTTAVDSSSTSNTHEHDQEECTHPVSISNTTAVDSPTTFDSHDDDQGKGTKPATPSNTTAVDSPATFDSHEHDQGGVTKPSPIFNTTVVDSPTTSDSHDDDQGKGTKPATPNTTAVDSPATFDSHEHDQGGVTKPSPIFNTTVVDSPTTSDSHDDEQGEGTKSTTPSSTTSVDLPSTSDTHDDDDQGEDTKVAPSSNTTTVALPSTSDSHEHDRGEDTKPATPSNTTAVDLPSDTHDDDQEGTKPFDNNNQTDKQRDYMNCKPSDSKIASCPSNTNIDSDTNNPLSDTQRDNKSYDTTDRTSPSSDAAAESYDLNCTPSGSILASFNIPQGDTKLELKLPNLRCSTFNLVLDYIYSGVIQLNEDNVEDILIAADGFMMEDLKELCWSDLGDRITSDNCIGIWSLSSRLGCKEVCISALRCLKKNFLEVYQGQEFLKLTADSLYSVLNQEQLNLGHDLHSLTNISENVVLRAFLRWVDFKKASRKKHLKKLLTTVRWATIKKDGDEYKSILESTKWKSAIEKTFEKALKKKHPKRSRGDLEAMVVCGAGRSNRHVFFIPINPVAGPRMCFTDLTYRRKGHSVIVAGGFMYAIGTGDSLESGHTPQCERYDPKTNAWSAIAPLNYGREACKLAAINKKIYCLGGYGNYGFGAPNEVYDIATNTWSVFPDIEMTVMSSDSYFAALNNKLYYLSETVNPPEEADDEHFDLEHPFRLIQCFDPETNRWSAKSPEFGEPQNPAGRVEDCIFVADEEYQFAYDTKRNTWEKLPALTCGGITSSLRGMKSSYDHIIRSQDSFYMLHSTGILQTSDPRLGEWELITPEGLPRDFPRTNKNHIVILPVSAAKFVYSVTQPR